jgi:CheY-like chemotaxis protein
MSATPALTVLVISEDPNEVEILHTAVKRIGATGTCIVRSTPDSTMQFFDGLNEAPGQTPHLILMCLNLSLNQRRLQWMSVVVETKRNPRLKSTPTIVLLEGREARDVNALYEMNLNCVLHKHKVLHEQPGLLETMCRFWLESALLPKQG